MGYSVSSPALQESLPALEPLTSIDFLTLCDEFFRKESTSPPSNTPEGISACAHKSQQTFAAGSRPNVIDLPGFSAGEESPGGTKTESRHARRRSRSKRFGSSKKRAKYVTLNPTAIFVDGVEYAWNNRRKQWLERNAGAHSKDLSQGRSYLGSLIEVRPDYCGLPIRLQYDRWHGIWQGMNDYMQETVDTEVASGMVQDCHSGVQFV